MNLNPEECARGILPLLPEIIDPFDVLDALRTKYNIQPSYFSEVRRNEFMNALDELLEPIYVQNQKIGWRKKE